MMLDHDFQPGFRIDLHIKDLVNALDTSRGSRRSPPADRRGAADAYLSPADGHGEEDHSGLVQHYEGLAGARLGA